MLLIMLLLNNIECSAMERFNCDRFSIKINAIGRYSEHVFLLLISLVIYFYDCMHMLLRDGNNIFLLPLFGFNFYVNCINGFNTNWHIEHFVQPFIYFYEFLFGFSWNSIKLNEWKNTQAPKRTTKKITNSIIWKSGARWLNNYENIAITSTIITHLKKSHFFINTTTIIKQQMQMWFSQVISVNGT